MTTIKEDYVSFEIAKLLKEKGFDEYCRAEWLEYIDGPSKGKTYLTECGSGLQHDSCSNTSLKKFNYDGQMYYAAPTLQMAMKYLRDVHNICIVIDSDICDSFDFYSIIRIKSEESWKTYVEYEDEGSNTYEEAIEKAIEYCLTNLI